jgi:tetratricopeptide (TPR) repeat protein
MTVPRRRCVVLALALAIAGVAGVGAYFALRSKPPLPPMVEVPADDPELAAAVAGGQRAVVDDPRSADAWGRLGLVLAAHRYPDEALICFREAERLAPTEPRWHYQQGIALSGRDPAAALEKYRRAAELGRTESLRLRLAETLLTLGQTDEAAAEFRELTRAAPDHPRANLGLARITLDRGDLAACEKHLAPATFNVHSRQAAATVLAELKYRQRDPVAAAAAQSRAAELPPDAPWPDPGSQDLAKARTGLAARSMLADELMDRGRFDEAERVLRGILRDRPGSDRHRVLLGLALVNRKDFAAAEEAMSEAVHDRAEAPRVHYLLGVAQMNQGRPAEAAEAFRRAVALKPDYTSAHVRLGDCLKAAADRRGAVEAYQAAIASRPQDPALYVSAAEALIEDVRPVEAAALLRQALTLDSNQPRARELLAKLGDGEKR